MSGALEALRCEAKPVALTHSQIMAFKPQLHADWQLDLTQGRLSRSLQFRNYYETMAFVNVIAWIAHQQDHHPQLQVSYNRCVIDYTTHSVQGLSLNDFICAAHIDAQLSRCSG